MDDDVAKLAQSERLIEAAELAARRGDARTASDLFERACAWDRASEQAAHVGDDGRALVLAVLARDDARASSLVGRAARSAKSVASAAATLEGRGEHAWRARLLEAAGRTADAARAWERAGDAASAARLLEAEGDVAGAARILESAARCEPSRADVSLALGALLLRFGKTEPAVRALQRVAGDAKERRAALVLLARGFATLGLRGAQAEAEAELTAKGGAPDEASAPPPPSTSPAGVRLFGRYQVVREVASSASARVIECIDTVRGERVAVKVFVGYDAQGAGRDAIARFEREVKVLARFHHASVVPLRDYVPDGPAIVLAWMNGGTLETRLAHESLTPARAAEIACAVLSALGEAHRLGVLHRDVKPANVLFDEAGAARLADFGVAHLGDLSATATAGVIGTLAYMSPEQREGRPATVRSDLFAVGAILLEMLTGERFRAGASGRRAPSAAHRDLGAAHDEIVYRLLAADPTRRPADAFEARRAILALSWPDAIEPAGAAHAARVASDRPEMGRAELRPDGTAYDRWIERHFVHAPLDPQSLARASAFARTGHPALQQVLRIDRESATIWLAPLGGHAPVEGLTRAQVISLGQALDALHALGVAHGHVDRTHVRIDDDGVATLGFSPACSPTATIDLDRLALARLASP